MIVDSFIVLLLKPQQYFLSHRDGPQRPGKDRKMQGARMNRFLVSWETAFFHHVRFFFRFFRKKCISYLTFKNIGCIIYSFLLYGQVQKFRVFRILFHPSLNSQITQINRGNRQEKRKVKFYPSLHAKKYKYIIFFVSWELPDSFSFISLTLFHLLDVS